MEFQTNIVLEEFFVDEDESITEIQLQSRGPKTLGHFPSIAERVEKKIFRRIPHRWESNGTFLNDKEFVEIDVFIL